MCAEKFQEQTLFTLHLTTKMRYISCSSLYCISPTFIMICILCISQTIKSGNNGNLPVQAVKVNSWSRRARVARDKPKMASLALEVRTLWKVDSRALCCCCCWQMSKSRLLSARRDNDLSLESATHTHTPVVAVHLFTYRSPAASFPPSLCSVHLISSVSA